MITLSDQAAEIVRSGTFVYRARYSSWLGPDLLAADIPVESGSEETDRTLPVPERVTISVPARDRGIDWTPTHDRHPLAASGQRLRVELGIGLKSTELEWFQRGEFVIVDSEPNGETLDVQCGGLLYLPEEARLVSPYQPTGTISAAIRALLEPAVTVVFDPLLADRTVPAGMNFDEQRLDGFSELLDAWPADYLMSAEGYVYVYSTTTPRPPVVTLTDGAGGLVIKASGRSTRDGARNTVVARGMDPQGATIQAVAYDTSGGPKSVGGPFNPLPVPEIFTSPLLTTVEQARAAAETVLARLRRDTGRLFHVELPPDPRLQVGDRAVVDCAAYSGLGEIESLNLPYVPGPMTLAVRAVDA